MKEIGNSKYKITYENGILSEWYGDRLKSQKFLEEEEVPEEEVKPDITHYLKTFQFASTLKDGDVDFSQIDMSNLTSMNSMFFSCKALQSLDLSSWDTSNVASMDFVFNMCSFLETLDLGDNWDMGNVTTISYMFNACTSLANVTGTISNIKKTIDLKSCPLTNESAMVFINGLANVTSTCTITFKADTYNTLTADQIQIATDKGWTVASA